jgi:hypothetical protein
VTSSGRRKKRPAAYAWPVKAAATGLALTLALATPAAAKGPVRTTVCGAGACRPAAFELITPIDSVPFRLAAAPRQAPFYTAVMTAPGATDGFCWRLVWVPARHALRVANVGRYVPGAPVAGSYWRTVRAAYERRFARAVRGLRAHPATPGWRGVWPDCAA